VQGIIEMDDQAKILEELEQLPQGREALHAELKKREAEIAALSVELDETNRGVVALYAELDVKGDQLRAASELKSRFLSYMSHEFKTPLGSIRSITRPTT
jgi:signal transduction histidine kinase